VKHKAEREKTPKELKNFQRDKKVTFHLPKRGWAHFQSTET